MKEEVENGIPSREQLAEFSGESVKDIENILSENDYRKDVISFPRKIRMIRKSLREQKKGLDLRLALINMLYTDEDISDEKKEAKRDLERAKIIDELTRIEHLMFTTRKKGFYLLSPSYKFEPHVGLNRGQRRRVTRMKAHNNSNLTPKKKKR